MVDAIGDAYHPEIWRLHLDSIDTSVTIKTLRNEAGNVVVAEQSLKSVLESQDGTNFCLCYVEDVVDEDNDPTFMLEWDGINYSAYEMTRRTATRDIHGWIKTTEPQIVKLKFETGSVHLLSLLENEGIPWENVYSMYITPKYNSLNQSSGAAFGPFLIDKAFNFIVGLAVKKFP